MRRRGSPSWNDLAAVAETCGTLDRALLFLEEGEVRWHAALLASSLALFARLKLREHLPAELVDALFEPDRTAVLFGRRAIVPDWTPDRPVQ